MDKLKPYKRQQQAITSITTIQKCHIYKSHGDTVGMVEEH